MITRSEDALCGPLPGSVGSVSGPDSSAVHRAPPRLGRDISPRERKKQRLMGVPPPLTGSVCAPGPTGSAQTPGADAGAKKGSGPCGVRLYLGPHHDRRCGTWSLAPAPEQL
ncbi:hypothetical protein VULLAG_LOCUS16937 [Vulpes lagopus]